jgi:arylsulfatase A-like enzyme
MVYRADRQDPGCPGKTGILQHTIIIFTGDHGDGLPRSKRTVYESGVKVPLNNLADDPKYQAVRNELRSTLDNWMQDIRDLGFTP